MLSVGVKRVFRPFGGGAALVLCQAEPADQGRHPAILPGRQLAVAMTVGEPQDPRRISSPRALAMASPRISATIRRSSARWRSAPRARHGCAAASLPKARSIRTTCPAPQRLARGPVLRAVSARAGEQERRQAGRADAQPVLSVYAAAAIAAGAEAYYVPARRETGFLPDFEHVPETCCNARSAAYFCSPSNPEGARAPTEDYWRALFRLAERYDFTVLADECYCEIYDEEPPLGSTDIRCQMRGDFERLLVVPFAVQALERARACARVSWRDGAADRADAAPSAMSSAPQVPLPVMAASAACWRDEAHVEARARSIGGGLRSPSGCSATCRASGGRPGGFYRLAGCRRRRGLCQGIVARAAG